MRPVLIAVIAACALGACEDETPGLRACVGAIEAMPSLGPALDEPVVYRTPDAPELYDGRLWICPVEGGGVHALVLARDDGWPFNDGWRPAYAESGEGAVVWRSRWYAALGN